MLIPNQTVVDFDSIIDVEGLKSIHYKMCAGIAKSHMLVGAVGSSQVYGDDRKGVWDAHQSLMDDPSNNDFLEGSFGLNIRQFMTYVALTQDVAHLGLVINLLAARTFESKHIKSLAVVTYDHPHFTALFDWVDKQGLFDEYARTIIFLGYPGYATPTHSDYLNRQAQFGDEFIWFRTALDKKFFLFDEATKTKKYISGYGAWFNNNQYHGTDIPSKFCFSVRVDGQFSQKAKDHIAKYVHASS